MHSRRPGRLGQRAGGQRLQQLFTLSASTQRHQRVAAQEFSVYTGADSHGCRGESLSQVQIQTPEGSLGGLSEDVVIR